MQPQTKTKFINSLIIPLIFPTILWIVQVITVAFNLDLAWMGVLPRTVSGILGIFTGPIIHAGFPHLISNTVPLIVLGWIIFFFFPKVAYYSFFLIYLMTDLLVWLFARQVYHIGASGIIYGFVSFLFFSGIFRRDNKSIALALLVTFLYGGVVWGILPGQEGISWESHLSGVLSGLLSAYVFRRVDPPQKYEWEDEPDDFNVDELEVSYDPEKNKFNV